MSGSVSRVPGVGIVRFQTLAKRSLYATYMHKSGGKGPLYCDEKDKFNMVFFVILGKSDWETSQKSNRASVVIETANKLKYFQYLLFSMNFHPWKYTIGNY
jgi:hypothetical protein